MSQSEDFKELFQRCNQTELLQILKRLGISVHPLTPRDKLIGMVLGETGVDRHNPLDVWRIEIMQILLDHWRVVRAQIKCPASSGDPMACFGCIDTQVLFCLNDNPLVEQVIQKKRNQEGQ